MARKNAVARKVMGGGEDLCWGKAQPYAPCPSAAQLRGVVRALGAAPAQGRVPRSAPALGGAGPRARCHPEDAAAGRLRLDWGSLPGGGRQLGCRRRDARSHGAGRSGSRASGFNAIVAAWGRGVWGCPQVTLGRERSRALQPCPGRPGCRGRRGLVALRHLGASQRGTCDVP